MLFWLKQTNDKRDRVKKWNEWLTSAGRLAKIVTNDAAMIQWEPSDTVWLNRGYSCGQRVDPLTMESERYTRYAISMSGKLRRIDFQEHI